MFLKQTFNELKKHSKKKWAKIPPQRFERLKVIQKITTFNNFLINYCC